MFITFLDGQSIEAHTYQSKGSTIRVAVRGREELLDLTCIRGQWVTENCEPVTIEFAWAQFKPAAGPKLEDCVWSPALAHELIEALHTAPEATAGDGPLAAFGAAAVVPM